MNMNTRALATSAKRYLQSLGAPLPENSDTEFYEQNNKDYQALLTLNKAGLGGSMDQIDALINAPLTDTEIKAIVKRISRLDALIRKEYEYQERVEQSPSYWNGFFSGYEPTPKGQCQKILDGIKSRISKFSDEQSSLFLKITREEAQVHGYQTDGMCDEDFRLLAAAA